MSVFKFPDGEPVTFNAAQPRSFSSRVGKTLAWLGAAAGAVAVLLGLTAVASFFYLVLR